MAKLLGPDFISLQVRNLSASRTFYAELLGLTIDERFNTPDFVLFDTNTIPFALSAAKDGGWRSGSTAIRSMSCIPDWRLREPPSSRHPSMVPLGAPSSLLTPMGTALRPIRTPGIGFL